MSSKEELKEMYENKIWKLKDGTKVSISGMSDDHIQKCIWAIENRVVNALRKPWLPLFKDEQEKRALKRKIEKL